MKILETESLLKLKIRDLESELMIAKAQLRSTLKTIERLESSTEGQLRAELARVSQKLGEFKLYAGEFFERIENL